LFKFQFKSRSVKTL